MDFALMDAGRMDMDVGNMDIALGAVDIMEGRDLMGAQMIGMGEMDREIGRNEIYMGAGMGMDMGIGMGMDRDMGMGIGMGMDRDMGMGIGMGMDRDMGMGIGMGMDRDMGMGIGMGMDRDMGMGVGMELGMEVAALQVVSMQMNPRICPLGCMGPCCQKVAFPREERVEYVEYAQQRYQTQPVKYEQICVNDYSEVQYPAKVIFQSIAERSQQTMEAIPHNKQQVLYEGSLYREQFSNWVHVPHAVLTHNTFLNISVMAINKLKVKLYAHLVNTRTLKVSTVPADFFFSVPFEHHTQWFSHIFWAKMATYSRPSDINATFEGAISGMLLKKSKIHGWEERYVLIDTQGLHSSRREGEKVTVHIQSTPELWSRFEIIRDNLVVIKLFRSATKMEFAIPTENATRWIKAFCSLIRV